VYHLSVSIEWAEFVRFATIRHRTASEQRTINIDLSMEKQQTTAETMHARQVEYPPDFHGELSTIRRARISVRTSEIDRIDF
jgi:hypothetical protein